MSSTGIQTDPHIVQFVHGASLSGGAPLILCAQRKFSKRLSTNDILGMLSKTDTVVTFDPETYEEKVQIVRNDINWEDVKRFRIKEIWFFDKETSTLNVRIMGIAPLIDVKDWHVITRRDHILIRYTLRSVFRT